MDDTGGRVVGVGIGVGMKGGKAMEVLAGYFDKACWQRC